MNGSRPIEHYGTAVTNGVMTLEWSPVNFGWAVWFWRTLDQTRYVLRYDREKRIWAYGEKVEENGPKPEPSLTFDGFDQLQMLADLVGEIGWHRSSNPTAEHLQDAIAVRDRLLKIVESTCGAKQ